MIHLAHQPPLPQLNLATVSLKGVKEIEQVLRNSTIKERLAIPGWTPNVWTHCSRPPW